MVVEYLRLTRVGKEERGYDALDNRKNKYQIKARRITRHNKSRQLGVIRNLDEELFDFLIAVIFDESFNILEMWRIPYRFVKENSKRQRLIAQASENVATQPTQLLEVCRSCTYRPVAVCL